MKLQKQLSRKSKDKTYSKYVVVIPPKEIENLGWKEGEELKIIKKDKSLVLQRKHN